MNKLLNNSLSTLLLNCAKRPVICLSDQSSLGCTQVMAKRFAGHSKWQNIKHNKMTQDQLKAQKINKMLSSLRWAMKQPGGPDAKLNREFAKVMEDCRKANIAGSTLDRAIKRHLEKRNVPLKLEIIGPNGLLMVVDAEAEGKGQLRNAVKQVLKKYVGFGFVDDGRASFAFEEKGVIRVKDTDKSGQKIDLEKAEEVAIEADAEEVKRSENDESVLVFLTEPLGYINATKYIEENTNFEVIDSGVELLPHQKIELPQETYETVATAIQALEELEEVVKVYDNLS